MRIEDESSTGGPQRQAAACNKSCVRLHRPANGPTFQPNALAIGENGGGDVLVLLADPHENRYGDAVYYWDHETGELLHVADTFDELMLLDPDSRDGMRGGSSRWGFADGL